ncbi:hypothetical protein KY334_07675 [Candidatus Woesearchaeota archaeon]|nr:hypothetical protein [Candidatus Woesearchaeota archaeon]
MIKLYTPRMSGFQLINGLSGKNLEDFFSSEELCGSISSVDRDFERKIKSIEKSFEEEFQENLKGTMYSRQRGFRHKSPDYKISIYEPLETSINFGNPREDKRPYDVRINGSEVVVKDMITGRIFSSAGRDFNPNSFSNFNSFGNFSTVSSNQAIPLIVQTGIYEELDSREGIRIPNPQEIKGDPCFITNYLVPFKANLSYLFYGYHSARYGPFSWKIGKRVRSGSIDVSVEVSGSILCDSYFGKPIGSEILNANISNFMDYGESIDTMTPLVYMSRIPLVPSFIIGGVVGGVALGNKATQMGIGPLISYPLGFLLGLGSGLVPAVKLIRYSSNRLNEIGDERPWNSYSQFRPEIKSKLDEAENRALDSMIDFANQRLDDLYGGRNKRF